MHAKSGLLVAFNQNKSGVFRISILYRELFPHSKIPKLVNPLTSRLVRELLLQYNSFKLVNPLTSRLVRELFPQSNVSKFVNALMPVRSEIPLLDTSKKSTVSASSVVISPSSVVLIEGLLSNAFLKFESGMKILSGAESICKDKTETSRSRIILFIFFFFRY